MQYALSESKFILSKLFSKNQMNIIQFFLHNVERNQGEYKTDVLWTMDQKIGGVGGYCMPSHPKVNPFPGGVERELFRPLQYARSEIGRHDVRMTARYVVQYSGMHLEAVLRYYFRETQTLGSLRFTRLTLGQAVKKLKKDRIIPDEQYEVLSAIAKLFNKAKHEVNHDPDRERLFSAADAIICYFGARIIGNLLLREVGHPLAMAIYKVNDEDYGL